MNEFLLRSTNSKTFSAPDKSWTLTKEYELSGCSAFFSWVKGHNYTPYGDFEDHIIAAIGIIYYEGERIDKKWQTVYQQFNTDLRQLATNLDGYGNLFIFNKRKNEGYVITSRMGFYALFYGNDLASENYAVGTNPDYVASCLQKNELDKESVAEFIATSCISAPYTYYTNIKQLEPASIYKIGPQGISRVQKYWEPELDHEDFLSEEESINRIAGFIRESVNKRINKNNGKGLLFLSGGLDSRAVLFAPQNPSQLLEAVTFYNEPNTELELATSLAQKAGVIHHPLKRHYDYYADLAIDTIKDTGGMWNFACLHMSGYSDKLREMNPGILLSGMYFDTFFKGFAFDKRVNYQKLTGKIFKEYPSQNNYWDARGSKDLKMEWKARLDERRRECYGYDTVPADELTPLMLNKIKYSRIGNMARIRSGGMDTALYKSQHYEMVVSDKNFSTIFSFLNPLHEIKSDFMPRVISRLTDQQLVDDANVVYSEYMMQNYYLTVARGVLRRRVVRKLFPQKDKNEVAMDSSWIDWYAYRKKSKKIKSLWKECDDYAGELANELIGFNPYKLEPDFSKSKYDFINLLTVGLWLKYGYKNSM